MKKEIPIPTLRRLPIYFKLFKDALAEKKEHLSSQEISQNMGIDPTQVRKDISMTGYVGKPKAGFETQGFIDHLKIFLKLKSRKKTIVIGIGNLGVAVSRYRGFDEFGLEIVSLFDSDLHKIGMKIHDCPIRSIVELESFIKENDIKIAILTVPMESAQDITDILVRSGICGIWNFTPVQIKTPENVVVWTQDLMAGFLTLLILMQQNQLIKDPNESLSVKHELQICMGSACHQMGSFEVLELIKGFLKEYKVENRVDIKGAFCLGNCAEGIVMKLNDQLIKCVTPDNAEEKFVNEILPVIG